MNVRYIIASGDGIARMAGFPKYRHVASRPGYELFENPAVLPRFFLVHQARTVGSLEEARALILGHQVDLRRTALVDQALTIAPSDGPDEVKTLKYQPNAIEVSTEASRSSLLVLSETYYPGWKAWVDDRPTPIYSTDIALRGVIVPPGVHRVRMEFRPLILTVSLGISLATAILLAILGFGMRLVVHRHQIR